MSPALEPPAFLVVNPGRPDERTVPVLDRIAVGRICAGVEESRRLIIEDPVASRTHFEIRLDLERTQAFLVDSSTNGTRINGRRVSRALPHLIKGGDWVTAGDTELAFVSSRFTGQSTSVLSQLTQAQINVSSMVLVVGDITNYSTIAQVAHSDVVAESLQRLYEELIGLLEEHRGTLNHYAGDALFATWELDRIREANELAVDFALAAHRKVTEIAPELPLRGPDGSPVRMGWAVVCGPAAVTTLTHAAVSALGDTTNLVFRLSGLAAREGRAPVIVSSSVHDLVEKAFAWGEPERLATKGRSGEETVYPVHGRAPAE